jgi:uncharacterized membrane protein
MYIIIFIVALVLFLAQNNRISKIEAQLKNFNGHVAVVRQEQPQAEASVTPLPVTNEPIKNKVSSEEASGRILGRIGIAAVVIGVSLFLKYAFNNNWVEPTGRVIIGLIIGIAIMSLAQYLRSKYLQYSDLLMGGGLVVLYLSIFAANAVYGLIDTMPTFLGMIIVTVIGVVISIVNATKTLSSVAFIGAYLTPILLGVGPLGQLITFTYLTILNAGVLGILVYKKWTSLTLTGLVGTWIIFGIWFASSYKENLLISTLIFLLIQFLIFSAASVFRIIIEKAKAEGPDYLVLLMTALSFSMTCYGLLMPQYVHYVSLGAVLIAGFYIVIALMAYKENPTDKTLNIFLPGLAVAFLTAAVPIEFDGPWIAAWWFIEALVMYILASSSSSRGFQVAGVVVYILGLTSLLNYLISYRQSVDYVIFFNGPFIMLIMATIIAYAIAYIYYKYGSSTPEIQMRGLSVFVIMANVLTLYAITTQITTYYELQQVLGITGTQVQNWSNTSVSIFWALYATMLTVIGFVKRFKSIRYMGLVLFIITAFKVVVNIWSLGEVYRIVSFIVFGIIALSASFIYVKYRERLING